MRARVLSWFYLLPPALLALGALGSFLAWHITESTSQRAARDAFEADIGRIVANIERQSARHDQVLRALASVIATQDTLSNDTTRALIRDIAGPDALRGVRTIGYIAFDDTRASLVSAVGFAAISTAVNPRANEAPAADTLRLATAPGLVRFVRERGPERAFLLRLDGAERTEEVAPNAVIGLGVSRSKSGVHPRSTELRGFVFLATQPAQVIEGALAGSARVAKIAVRASDGVRAQMPLFADRGADDPNPSRARATRTVRLAERDATLAASAAANAYPQYSPNKFLIALPFALGLLIAAATAIFLAILQWRVRAAELRTPSVEARDLLFAQLEAMVGATAEALVAVDSLGLVVAANPAAENLFRLTPYQMRTKKLIELLPDSSIERLQSAMENGQSSNDGAVRRARLHGVAMRRGARVPVELNLGVVAAKSDMMVCLIRDVSEHQRVEEEMRLYKRAIASSSNAIVISDVTMADHPILYINPAFERMTGYDLADSFGRNSRFMQGPDTDKSAVAKMRAAIERGLDAQVTLKNYTKEGEAFWNHITLAPVRDRNSKVTHYIGIQTDVTETKLVEAALEERRQQLDAIFNLSPDGFVAFNRDRRATYVNAAFLRITGLDQEHLQNTTLDLLDAQLTEIQDPAHPYRTLATVLADHADADLPELKTEGSSTIPPDIIHLRNPAPRTIQRSIRRASGGSGGSTEFVLYLRDITRESELDRMKSEFLSSAAHELRTPMVSIFGFAELLMKRKFPEERQKEMLETIHRQSKHLTNMVNELLDLARIEARAGKDFQLEELPLAPIIEQTLAGILMPNDARKVEIELAAVLPVVRIDAGKMQRALTNIIANAYKYSPAGGRIRVWTEERRARDRNFIGIRVSDEGIGMTPEQLSHACERFYRADTSGNIPGTGLGLSLVKEIMELLGGSIEMESEFGRGSVATLWLPVAAHEARAKVA